MNIVIKVELKFSYLIIEPLSLSVMQCDKKCGGGTQYRMVQCVNMTSQQSSHGCDFSTKPEESKECNTEPCGERNAGTITLENYFSWISGYVLYTCTIFL